LTFISGLRSYCPLKRAVQAEDERGERRNMRKVQSFRSETQLGAHGLEPTIQQMLREMRQDAVNEQYKTGKQRQNMFTV
jgi:hypothetical protein